MANSWCDTPTIITAYIKHTDDDDDEQTKNHPRTTDKQTQTKWTGRFRARRGWVRVVYPTKCVEYMYVEEKSQRVDSRRAICLGRRRRCFAECWLMRTIWLVDQTGQRLFTSARSAQTHNTLNNTHMNVAITHIHIQYKYIFGISRVKSTQKPATINANE